MIEVGTILQNRYRIEKQIGQGGMGKVYVASDERFGDSTVAIKETVFEDTNLRRAFEREARLLNSLKHQALPRVSDHFTEDDGQFLVMEYIAGEDLAEMMEREAAAFPLEKVLNWANQLCDALDYLHAQEIIHRDIKPQNLKLTPGGQIVLLDFGLAKGNPTDSQNQTAAKSIFGYSRSYASLEQIQGTGTEPRSDLYSLGATLYHLLTGIPPADALTRAMNVLNKQPDPLIAANVVNRQIPAGVAEVLQKSMALNAGERPVSASEMRRLLEESDKTINSDEAESGFSKPSPTNLLTQETKIKPLATSVAASNQSQIATKIIPGKISDAKSFRTTVENTDSVVTSVRSSETENRSSKRYGKLYAGAAAVLLFIGTAFSALYFYGAKDALAPNAENNLAPGNFVIHTVSDSNAQNTNTTDQGTIAENNNANSKSAETAAVAAKPNQTAKNQSRQTKNQSSAKNQKKNDVDPIIVNEDRIETKDVIVDKNGVKMKMPDGKTYTIPTTPMPPGYYRDLKPEQLEKLRQLQEMNKRIIVVKTPTPKPTP